MSEGISTKIHIWNSNEKLRSVDKRHFSVKKTRISRNYRTPLLSLRGRNNLSNVQQVELFLENEEINIPDVLKESIVKYLRLPQKERDQMDCYSFANIVMGVEHHFKCMLRTAYDIEKVNSATIPGEVIIFTTPASFFKKENTFHHAAVYIGHDLYISVYGGGGDLEVSTFKQMKKLFKGKEVYKLSVNPILPDVWLTRKT